MVQEVHIRRREVKSYLPIPIVASSIKVLGSVYSGQGPLRGLEGEEERELLSRHLGLDKSDPNLFKAIRDFWVNLRIKVSVTGVDLNVGKTLETVKIQDKGKKEREITIPSNIKDYCVYNWCLRHPYVAKDKEELSKDSKKMFYIHDPEVATKQQNKEVRVRKDAYREFIKESENPEKLRKIITILDDVEVSSLNDTEIENQAENLLNKDPKRFLDVITDKNIELKSFIAELISQNIIRKVGNSIYFMEQKLGETSDEAVLFLKDKKNSETVIILKEKLAEAKRR